jgi:Zn-dependent protease
METLPYSFTPAARQVLDLAAQPELGRPSSKVEPEHMLLAILKHKSNLAVRALTELKVDTSALTQALSSPSIPTDDSLSPSRELSLEAKQTLSYAAKEANHLGHKQVDALHLLTGLLYDGHGLAHDALEAQGVSLFELRQHVLQQPKAYRRFGAARQDRLRDIIRPSPVFLLLLAGMFASGAALWRGVPENAALPITVVFVICGWIASVCVHEFGHALAAYLGGDHSVKDQGYLTLNPLKYTHPVLSIGLPLLFLLMGGLGLPGGAVYINHNALRSPRWETIVAAAGPLGTLVFLLLTSIPFWFEWPPITDQNYYFWTALAYLAFTQVTALMFNLLPVPPLDGFGIIERWLSYDVRVRLRSMSSITFLLLFILMRGDNPFANAFWNQAFDLTDLLRVPVYMVFEVMEQLFW